MDVSTPNMEVSTPYTEVPLPYMVVAVTWHRAVVARLIAPVDNNRDNETNIMEITRRYYGDNETNIMEITRWKSDGDN